MQVYNGIVIWNDTIDFDPDTLYTESKQLPVAVAVNNFTPAVEASSIRTARTRMYNIKYKYRDNMVIPCGGMKKRKL